MHKKSRSLTSTIWYPLLLVLLTLALILDSRVASQATIRGIDLCLRTVIPALFPLMVTTRLLMNTSLPRRLGRRLGHILSPVFHLPPEALVCLALGLLGGYPAGAQTVAIAYERGLLTRAQAEHMLGFCNNAGPAFVFGMVGALMGGFTVALTLYLIHILSALLVGVVLKPGIGQRTQSRHTQPIAYHSTEPVLQASIKTMATICGYVVVFCILSAFWDKYLGPILPQVLNVGAAGILELASGCLRLAELDSPGWQYCMVSGFLAFGGLCVWMQIRSVLAPAGLTGQYYFLGKILQSAIAILLTWAVLVLAPGLLPRQMPAVNLPNHEGLLTTLLWVFAAACLLLGIWCVILRNRAGKAQTYGV